MENSRHVCMFGDNFKFYGIVMNPQKMFFRKQEIIR